MSTDQIIQIVREVLATEPSSPDAQICATLEVLGNSDAWLQFIPGTFNFAYPLATDPAAALGSLLASLPESSVVSWEPGTFATVTFSSIDPRVVASTIDALLTTLFSLGSYSVSSTIEELPA